MVDLFTEVYNWLPLCHLLDNKVLVMHGGLFAKVSEELEKPEVHLVIGIQDACSGMDLGWVVLDLGSFPG